MTVLVSTSKYEIMLSDTGAHSTLGLFPSSISNSHTFLSSEPDELDGMRGQPCSEE